MHGIVTDDIRMGRLAGREAEGVEARKPAPLKTIQLPYVNTFESIWPDLTVLTALKIDRLLGRNKIDDNRRTDRIKFFSPHRPREDP